MSELFETRLGSAHVATGFTRHYANDALLPPPSWLRIVQYDEGGGYYLLYLNELLEEQTDTWHETVEDAMEQARLEFGIAKNDWINLSSD